MEPEGLAGMVFAITKGLVLSLPTMLCGTALFASTPVLASSVERHPTESSKDSAIFLKLTFFQVA